jgi:hypothetical protein
MGNLPGQKTGVLRGYLQISKRTHENTLFTGQTSMRVFSCVLLLLMDTIVVILHKKVPLASFSIRILRQLK